jgi:hypothetical protein
VCQAGSGAFRCLDTRLPICQPSSRRCHRLTFRAPSRCAALRCLTALPRHPHFREAPRKRRLVWSATFQIGGFSQADSGNRAPSCRPSASVDKLSKWDDLRQYSTMISECCPGIADGHSPTFGCQLIFVIHGLWSGSGACIRTEQLTARSISIEAIGLRPPSVERSLQ